MNKNKSICRILEVPYDCLTLCLDKDRPGAMRLVCRDFRITQEVVLTYVKINLRRMQLHGFEARKAAELLSRLPSLNNVELSTHIGSLLPASVNSALWACSGLTSLHIERGWDAIPLHVRLQRLTLSSVSVDFSPLSSCSALEHLRLISCNALMGHLSSLTACSSLVSLEVSRSSYVDISPLRALTALTSLALNGMPLIQSVEALRDHPRLSSLKLTHALEMRERSSLEAIGSCSRLEDLTIARGCPAVVDLHWIVRLSSLTSLDLRDCMNLASLQPLSNCSLLRTLDVRGCQLIQRPTQFWCLDVCTHLEELRCDIDVVLRGGVLRGGRGP